MWPFRRLTRGELGSRVPDELSVRVSYDDQERRDQFLLKMYDQMWGNITRHVNVVWQSIAAVGASLALFSFTTTGGLSLDYAATAIVVLAGWQVANVLDAGEWFNRNITIIGNIEREFLQPVDRRRIYPKLGRRPPLGDLERHFRIQLWLGRMLGVAVVAYHFSERVRPNFGVPGSSFELPRVLPVLTLVVTFLVLVRMQRRIEASRRKLLADLSTSEQWDGS